MKIAIGSDHGGFHLKKRLIPVIESLGHQVEDVGCHDDSSVDYPDYAELVSQKIIAKDAELGILICGTGIGMSIAANRHYEIRAAVCHDEYTAEMARQHNNANILCIGERVLEPDLAEKIVEVYLSTEFELGGRHQRRIDKFSR